MEWMILCVFAAGSLLLGPSWLCLSVHLPSDWSGKERGIIYGFLGVTATCTCVCACVSAIDCLQDDSFKWSMNEDRQKGDHWNIKKCLQEHICQYTHTVKASLSPIFHFKLAGRFSMRFWHYRGVRWNIRTSNHVRLTSYFLYNVSFVFCCCGAWQHFELATLTVLHCSAEHNGHIGK